MSIVSYLSPFEASEFKLIMPDDVMKIPVMLFFQNSIYRDLLQENNTDSSKGGQDVKWLNKWQTDSEFTEDLITAFIFRSNGSFYQQLYDINAHENSQKSDPGFRLWIFCENTTPTITLQRGYYKYAWQTRIH